MHWAGGHQPPRCPQPRQGCLALAVTHTSAWTTCGWPSNWWPGYVSLSDNGQAQATQVLCHYEKTLTMVNSKLSGCACRHHPPSTPGDLPAQHTTDTASPLLHRLSVSWPASPSFIATANLCCPRLQYSVFTTFVDNSLCLPTCVTASFVLS